MSSTLFAIDYSGSTSGSPTYHISCHRIVEEKLGSYSSSTPTFLLWNTEEHLVSRTQLEQINKNMKGEGGTDPNAVANYVKRINFHGHLLFISDGLIDQSTVDICSSALAGWKFESVHVILIHAHSRYSAPNMSVSCAFTRNSPHMVDFISAMGDTRRVASVSNESLSLLDRLDDIHTVKDWLAIKNELTPVIIARTMGTTGDPTLRDTLLRMKSRIQRMDAESSAESHSLTINTLTISLAKSSDNPVELRNAISAAQTLRNDYYTAMDGYAEDDTSWSSSINRLVSMCDGALYGTFDLSGVNAAIHSDRARRAPMATVVKAEDTDAGEPIIDSSSAGGAGGFVCPITYDETNDIVLLVTQNPTPLLAGLDKSIVTDLTKCPLFLFRYADVESTFLSQIDHPISLEGLKGIYGTSSSDDGSILSPLTRKPILGALCLGPHKDHVAATNWTLARMTAGGKCLGNPDLWFAALWLLVKRGKLPYLSPILPQLTTHLCWRMQNHKAPLSLLGTPEYPTTRVPLGTALWFAIASSVLSPLPNRETLRAHLPYVEEIQELLSMIGYALPVGFSEHLSRLRTVFKMLSWCKRDNVEFQQQMRGLYQAAILSSEGKVLALIDGPASTDQIARICSYSGLDTTLSDTELIGLSTLVSPGKSASDVHLPFNWSPLHSFDARIEWKYGVKEHPSFVTPICTKTCRPFFHCVKNNGNTSTWMDAAEEKFHLKPDDMLPVHAEFGNYVVKNGSYPAFNDLLDHLWKRVQAQTEKGKTTLPAQTEVFIRNILEDYSEVVSLFTPEEFTKRFLASRKREDRVRIEHERCG